MTHSIVFIGNCQVGVLFSLYKRFAGLAVGQRLQYVQSYEHFTDRDRTFIQHADLIIEQLQDFAAKGDITEIETSAERIRIPVVSCGFLWPFAGQPHPQNPSPPYLVGLPYGAELSDAWLNRMVNLGIEPEFAVGQYLQLDVNNIINLDRLFEISTDKQRERDKVTDFKISEIIEEFFRDEPIFLTPYHPNVRVTLALASQLFRKLGVSPQDVDRMYKVVRITPFPKDELPIHPYVCEHFGLRYIREDYHWRFMNEGYFGFADFAQRYMRCTWNEPLEQGMSRLDDTDAEAVYELLKEGLLLSPKSLAAHGAIAHVLGRLGRYEEAINALERGIGIHPEAAALHGQLGALLRRRGDVVGAERALRQSIQFDPFEPHLSNLLADLLRYLGRTPEAIEVIRAALEANPYVATLHLTLGRLLNEVHEEAAAEAAFRRVEVLDPSLPEGHIELSELLERRGQFDEAIDVLQRSIQRDPQNLQIQARLGYLADQSGAIETAAIAWQEALKIEPSDLKGYRELAQLLVRARRVQDAEWLLAKAIKHFPTSAALHFDLAEILMLALRDDEAAAALRNAISLDPDTVSSYVRLADLEIRQGDLIAAEQHLMRATAINKSHAHAYGQLGYVFSATGRHAEAIAIRRKALELEPKNPHRHAQVGHVLMAAGEYAEAEAAIRHAISLKSEGAFYFDLSHVLGRAGRLQDAIAAVQKAIAVEPTKVNYLGHLGDLLYQAEQLKEAEEAICTAAIIEPENMHWQEQLTRIRSGLGYSRKVPSDNVQPFRSTEEATVTSRLNHDLASQWAELRALFPKQRIGYLEGTRALIETAQYAEAKDIIGEARKLWPEDRQILEIAAELAFTRRDISEAIACGEELRRLFPEAPVGFFHSSRALREAHRHQEAAIVLKDAPSRFPGDAGILSIWASLAMFADDWPEAIRRWYWLQERFPKEPKFVWQCINCLRRLGKNMEADEMLEVGVHRFPEDAVLLSMKGTQPGQPQQRNSATPC